MEEEVEFEVGGGGGRGGLTSEDSEGSCWVTGTGGGMIGVAVMRAE